MPTYLNVPFSEKDQVKALGARFDSTVRQWYVPDGRALTGFESWLPSDAIPANDAASNEKGVSLSAAMAQIANVVHQQCPTTWIRAEISELNIRKHAYLQLVERDDNGSQVAKANANCWQQEMTRILAKFEKETGSQLQPGMKVLLQVRPSMHPQYGLSLNITDIDPSFTVGEMQRKLQLIIKSLTNEGIIDNNKRLPVPKDFTRVAVISPRGAAGLGDFRREANILQHAALVHFDYFEATFQGEAAEDSFMLSWAEVIEAHFEEPYDAVALIRGGGAVADLAWLNSEKLARAICLSPLPVFTGIGHERDNTLPDLVSAVRFDTPSKVSAYIAGTVVQNARQAMKHHDMLFQLATQRCDNALSHCKNAAERIQQNALNTLDKTESNLSVKLNSIFERAHNGVNLTESRMKELLSQITGFDARNILKQGYAIVRSGKGHIASAQALDKSKDGTLSVQFQDGERTLQKSTA